MALKSAELSTTFKTNTDVGKRPSSCYKSVVFRYLIKTIDISLKMSTTETATDLRNEIPKKKRKVFPSRYYRT